jgi:hypothetical protein
VTTIQEKATLTLPAMEEKIWTFLVANDVKRVRQIGDTFEFLLDNDQVLSPKQLCDRFVIKINAKRPKMRGPGGRSGRPTLSFRLDLDSLQMRKDIWTYLSKEDMARDNELNVELTQGREIFKALSKLLNRVRFRERRLPDGELVPFLRTLDSTDDLGRTTAQSKSGVLRELIKTQFPNLKQFETVPGSIRAKILSLLNEKGITMSQGTLRTYLMRLDYSKGQKKGI